MSYTISMSKAQLAFLATRAGGTAIGIHLAKAHTRCAKKHLRDATVFVTEQERRTLLTFAKVPAEHKRDDELTLLHEMLKALPDRPVAKVHYFNRRAA